eukprot:scpid109352/ scgid8545/ 
MQVVCSIARRVTHNRGQSLREGEERERNPSSLSPGECVYRSNSFGMKITRQHDSTGEEIKAAISKPTRNKTAKKCMRRKYWHIPNCHGYHQRMVHAETILTCGNDLLGIVRTYPPFQLRT